MPAAVAQTPTPTRKYEWDECCSPKVNTVFPFQVLVPPCLVLGHFRNYAFSLSFLRKIPSWQCSLLPDAHKVCQN